MTNRRRGGPVLARAEESVGAGACARNEKTTARRRSAVTSKEQRPTRPVRFASKPVGSAFRVPSGKFFGRYFFWFFWVMFLYVFGRYVFGRYFFVCFWKVCFCMFL